VNRSRFIGAVFVSIVVGACNCGQAALKRLSGHVPSAVARVRPTGRLVGATQLRLSVGLPLRNAAGLNSLLSDMYDPKSPNYRHFLSSAEFAARFGPTEEAYGAVIGFAQSNNLSVVGVEPNRMLLTVSGSVEDTERAFHVTLSVYPHPSEARTFFAPDVEPSVESSVPVLAVRGLNDYVLARPRFVRRVVSQASAEASPRVGSGPGGSLLGNDFRKAYVPGTTLTGAGQTLGLFELDGYYTNDISAYIAQAGISSVPIKKILIDGFNGVPSGRAPGSANEEVALDIEMSISMAPGLDQVLVYEGNPHSTATTIDDVMNRMATDNIAKQLSCSWGFDISATTRQIFLQYAAQGQSFFLASGDSGAFSGRVDQPSDEPNITVVGGTVLGTTSAGAWFSESVWNGSGGGISTTYPIPEWQLGIGMSANQGSTSMRNLPDVAMVADNVWIHADRGSSFSVVGTSIAAPLWAAFTAMVNEQGAVNGLPPVGFLNPTLYAIGKSSSFTESFHDIVSGNNFNGASPSLFKAATGYDLCTGWGTPKGTNLINALLVGPSERLVVTSPLGYISTGAIGGPFSVSSASYTLVNAGSDQIDWAISDNTPWLSVSATGGSLAANGGSTNLTIALSPVAAELLLGSYAATITFANLTDGSVQSRSFSLLVGNGGFENGDFSNWTPVNLDPRVNLAISTDQSTTDGQDLIPGLDDSIFVHSGLLGAFLGQNTSMGYISQRLPTVSGQRYTISFWLDNPVEGVPNQFQATWNGTNLFDQNDMGAFTWTKMEFVATATSASTVLQFGFRNDQNAFGLDDISVSAAAAPAIETFEVSDGILTIGWHGEAAQSYQVQYATSIGSGSWVNLSTPIRATDSSLLTIADTISTDSGRFYRLVIQP